MNENDDHEAPLDGDVDAELDDDSDDVVGMAMGPSLRGGLMDLSLGKPTPTAATASLTEDELRRLGGR